MFDWYRALDKLSALVPYLWLGMDFMDFMDLCFAFCLDHGIFSIQWSNWLGLAILDCASVTAASYARLPASLPLNPCAAAPAMHTRLHAQRLT